MRAPHVLRLKEKSQRACRRLRLLPRRRIGGIRRIPEDRHPGQAWHDLLQQLQPFPTEFRSQDAQPREVAAWPRQARHYPPSHGVDRRRHDDRNRLGRVLGGERCRRGGHENAIDPEPDQLGGEFREALGFAFREPALEDEVPPFAIPAFPQPVQERLPQVGGEGIRRQEADPVDLARRLRRSG